MQTENEWTADGVQCNEQRNSRHEKGRLLIVSTEFPPAPGGIGTHAYQVALHLHRIGWNVTVISQQDFSTHEEIEAFNRLQGFRIERLQPVSGSASEAVYRWKVMARWAARWQPDVLVATGARAVWLSAVLAKRYDIPWIAVGHGTEFGFRSRWQRIVTKWAFSQASSVVCVSHYTNRQMLALGVHPRQSHVIPNGADATRFVPLVSSDVIKFRSKLGLDGDRLLLTVGMVSERKGQDVVIKALPHIMKEVPNTHYLVAGNPRKKADFELLAHELGVEKHVHFLGQVPSEELVQYLGSCDLFVMTSKRTPEGDCEGYGIAVIEAAMCGKPAVVSNNSGLIEAIINGETGLGVPEGDELATAQAIICLLKDSDLRSRLAQAAQHRARTEQTWEHRVLEYDRMLRGLVAEARTLSPRSQTSEAKETE